MAALYLAADNAPRHGAHGNVHRRRAPHGGRREGVFLGGGLPGGRRRELAGEGLARDGDAEEDVLGLLAARRREPRRQLREVEVGTHGLEEAVRADVVGRVPSGPEMQRQGSVFRFVVLLLGIGLEFGQSSENCSFILKRPHQAMEGTLLQIKRDLRAKFRLSHPRSSCVSGGMLI